MITQTGKKKTAMNNKRELPLFSVSHNPLVKGKEDVSYIVVHHRDEKKRATVEVNSWRVLEGEIDDDLLSRCQQWYHMQYLPYINQ
jgi:hypothetical protein